MFAIVVLAILSSNSILIQRYVTASHKQPDDNDEERIVVKKLASIIRQQEQKNLKDIDRRVDSGGADIEEKDDELVFPDGSSIPGKSVDSPFFTFQALSPIKTYNSIHSNSEPFAVPPSDIRFYKSDFSVSDTPDSNQQPHHEDEKIIILSSAPKAHRLPDGEELDNQKKNEKKNDDRLYEDTGRKIFTHHLLNPSLIPVGDISAKSIRMHGEGTYVENKNTTYLLAITYGTMCALLVISTVSAFMIYRKLRKKVKDAEDIDYPAYGVTGPCKETLAPTGDRHLAHSAQMYHYQHQKQQIKSMEKDPISTTTRKGTDSGSEEDDFAVYECPGLAPVTGEMEVKNPMFQEETDVESSPPVTEKHTWNYKKNNMEVDNKNENKK